MTLQVIGSGFGRTGTKSLKAAPGRLGFGPCHHMHGVVADRGRVVPWQTLAQGSSVDWTVGFDGFRSQVDWPGAHVWRELAETFPDAKVVHTLRPEDNWWASHERTIGKLIGRFKDLPIPTHISDMLTASTDLVGQQTFVGMPGDQAIAVAAFPPPDGGAVRGAAHRTVAGL